MERLLKLARRLRDPEKGCPWDLKQNFESFRKCLLDEAQEVADAIEKKDYSNLCEELGDTLFNIVFLINLAEEKKLFTMEDVVSQVYQKMVGRHPHVFGAEKASDPEKAYELFQEAKKKFAQKKQEKKTREEAWQLLCKYTQSESLRKHALAVEAVMAACAEKYGEDVEKWRIVGLLHDFDYEKYPTEHPLKGVHILKDEGYSEEIQKAILCHVESTGFSPKTNMEKSLYAVDELCGFIIAVALVRPSKKLSDTQVKSVKKKLKDKGFAKSVSREAIYHGVELLGTNLDSQIKFVLHSLGPIAEKLGM